MKKPKSEKSISEMFAMLREFVDIHSTKKEAAEILGVSESYLGDLYHGRRTICASIAQKFGYKKKTVFEQIEFLEVSAK